MRQHGVNNTQHDMIRKLPFRFNPKIAARNAKLRRLMKAGKLQPMTKQQMRQLLEQHRAQCNPKQQ
jgi:hypothetical protein